MIPEVVDAAGGWPVEGGVVSAVTVLVEPLGEGADEVRALYDETIVRILSVVVAPTTSDLDLDEFARLRSITSKLHPHGPSRV